ncbi:ATPase, P-type (transporting), HAD superfamily, subfamily IC/heavy metal translocating P-type ATPase [Thauera chlorobenzoica]|uniref:P-type Zn(2+) transporter n=2 Tax=Thauera chlorobenzoica TaxID=96773 RepID=A0A1H5WQX3_9RHOO|nr:cation-transporting ATPase [Thauera chlorobenzoica]SEG01725.1 ATPase, P-type (transporting), HAD superfamily, subfamily IC/heavy metal translocating P-type ATPase [Thauera chlorobenzoica]
MARWFASLDVVHQVRGRVRLRYRCDAGVRLQARAVQRAVEGLHGVRRARLNPQARALIIEFAADRTGVEQLVAAVSALSPAAVPAIAPKPLADGDAARLGAVALSAANLLAGRALGAGLQAPMALGVAVPLLGEAVDDFLQQGVTSHVLEALAVAISIGRRDYLAANTTSFLLALGEYLEYSIQRRSDDLLKHLLEPASGEVWVERGGVEALVDAAELRMGDTVIAAAGTVVPVDGTVLGGEAMVNEATMTGESVPVARRRGDRVLSGTVVAEGRLRIYAEHVGAQAAAARIADFVERSLAAKSRTQLEASRMADRLVPMVLGLAVGTWALTRDWRRVAAVLQADYSCALKLSTPVAFKAAMYRAGRAGMLVKGADALERLAEADTFVFDKTGTLTSGHLEVTDSVAFRPDFSSADLINLAASVEEHYFHPLALAVVEASRRLDKPRHFDHKEVEFIVAHGVASVIDGKRIVVGSRHFVEDDEGIDLAAHGALIERLHEEGKTLLYIGFGGEPLGVLALRDSLRGNSADTVHRLRRLGVKRVLMLTGDHPARAAAMAGALGLDGFHAGLLPHDKARLLQELADDGAQVAFIGDGVNDAPALSGAHVGISMHQGADIARLASDIALLEDDIARVADARALALATGRLVKSNFRLTVGLNTAILSAAALGLLSPVSASLLHNGSTIAILLRALLGAGLPRAPRGNEGRAAGRR